MVSIDNDILRKKRFNETIKKILSSKENMIDFLKKVHPIKDKIKNMKQEDKELLLKEICARLCYGVLCDCLHDYHVKASAVDIEDLTVYYSSCDEWESIEYCRPYLRRMSSMTEEEKEQIRDFWIDADVKTHATQLIDFYNKYHFDYRGLIEKGLALEAPNEMYKKGE